MSVRAAARRFTALALALALCFLSACAGGKSSETGPESKTPYTDDADLTFDITPVSYPYRLAEEEYGGEPLRLTEEARAAFLNTLEAGEPVFPYADIDGVEETFGRLSALAPVAAHRFDARDENGELTASHLFALIKENNVAFVAEYDAKQMSIYRFTEPGDGFLERYCVLISDMMREMRARFPDIDWARVYCNLGQLKVTYETMIRYLETMELTALCYDDVPADFGASLPFYDDPALLFRMFRSETPESRLSLAHLMREIDIMQFQPPDFWEIYTEKTGRDLKDDDELDALCYSIKPSVCLCFAKNMFRSLTEAVSSQPVTARDLYALLRLFEASLDMHLGLWENRTPELNAPFLAAYRGLRAAFFEALAASGSAVGEEAYGRYAFFSDGTTVNASLLWLPPEK